MDSGSKLPLQERVPTQRRWWEHLLWVVAGTVLGFVIAAVFAGLLRLPRNTYLFPYIVLVILFLYAYARWSKLDMGRCLRQRWGWGLIGGIIVGVFVVQSVLRQPSSPAPKAVQLAVDLLWPGIVYGTVDGLLLSVMPVLAVRRAFSESGWAARLPGRFFVGLLALVASMFVVAVYHLGYPEFRGAQVIYPLFGVGVMSLAFIVTGNPLSAIISHVAMHMAAVLHGLETVIQLPPHY